MQNLRDKYLTPILDNLNSNTDYQDIITAVKTIESEYNQQCTGAAKKTVFDEFTKVDINIANLLIQNYCNIYIPLYRIWQKKKNG